MPGKIPHGNIMSDILTVTDLTKTYDNGFSALKGVNLSLREGEILALLGPNGAGKTTLISTICGITRPSSGRVVVAGHDIETEFRAARDLIGLVPQELNLEPFEPVEGAVTFSRGLFGKPADPAHVEKVLRQLSLWDKRKNRMRELSGGMKRRVLIAKALVHEPRVLFLDEPTAGVDVELRKDMWRVVEELRREGVTIILTTHYIEEAEAIADRIGIIRGGEILLVEDKATLMQRLGKKQVHLGLRETLTAVPEALAGYDLALGADGQSLIYTYDTNAARTGITALLAGVAEAGLHLRDIDTAQKSLEEIFMDLVTEDAT